MKKFFSALLFLLLVIGLVAVIIYSGPGREKISENFSYTHQLLFGDDSSHPEESENTEPKESEEESESDTVPPSESVPEYTTESDLPEESTIPIYEHKEVRVNVFSTEGDLYIAVRDTFGGIIYHSFRVKVTSRNYSKVFSSDEKGTLYINELAGGSYTVSVQPEDGFILPNDVTCEVKAGVEKKPIANIKDKITVHITTPANNREITGQREDANQGTVSEITSDAIEHFHDESVPEGNTVESDTVYTYQLGPYGFLVSAKTSKESDVKPIFVNNLLAYGEREVYTLIEGTVDQYNITKERVELFDAKGEPLSDFKIARVYIPPTVLTGWQTIEGKTYYYNDDGKKITGYAKINGKHYYFDNNGVKASSMIIDVSEWQTVRSWAQVKAAGIDGVIVRIGGRGYGSGSIYSDENALSYLKNARAAGLKIGIYFFSAAINATEAVEEASWALAQLNGMKLDYPIYIDMEHSGDYPNGRADKLSQAQHTSVATAFCDTVISAGYKAGVYASYYYLRDELKFSTIKKYDIWLANYTTNYQMTTFPYAYDLWQFTPKASISGIAGNVDLNVKF